MQEQPYSILGFCKNTNNIKPCVIIMVAVE